MVTALKPYPAMKDSGLEWLGTIPDHWHLERAKWLFRDVERPVREGDEVVTCFRDGTVTLRKNRRLTGFTEALKEIGYQGVRRGDLVIHVMDAFAGAIGVSDSDGKCTPVYAICRPESLADPHYYARLVREMARRRWLLALAKGVRERSTDFRFAAFAVQRLPVPSLPEQAAIVRYLDHVDRRINRYIRAKQHLIELLEEEKQAIIHRAVTRGLDADVRFKSSGVEWLGDVPEHWEALRLRDCSRIQTGPFGSQLHADEYISGGVPIINPANVVNGRLDPDDERTITPTKVKEMSRHAFKAGDLAFGRRGEMARVALVLPSDLPALCGTGCLRVDPHRQRVESSFLLLALGLNALRGWLELVAVGSTLANLNERIVGRIAVALPPRGEQRAIAAYLDHETAVIDTAIDTARRETELLREYRTRLIADVVTGKLDVREVAADLPEVDAVGLEDIIEIADVAADEFDAELEEVAP